MMAQMMETYGVMGVPGLGIIGLLIVGAIAGWLAEKITGSNHGLLMNVGVGIVGAIVGTAIANFLGISVYGWLMHIIAATAGAVLVLFVWRKVRSPA